ncbi:unnamed protein product [Phytomonas sp. EM1]|nr:unnamed protein product [Phytomonas sp. EM1]|eukprot:CCW61751.1 unnamed protein product [Phytomonas sp. isolate EM1]
MRQGGLTLQQVFSVRGSSPASLLRSSNFSWPASLRVSDSISCLGSSSVMHYFSSGTAFARRVYCTATPLCLKDVYKNDRGEARRLTFEERAERRTKKTRDQKQFKEQLIHEAETMVNSDFPGELEHIYAKTLDRANISAMKVLNMVKCLELLEIEVSGGHSVLLTKVAQVVKIDANTVEIIPHNNNFGNTIMQCVSRFDSSMQVSKEGSKVKIVVPPITTARRDKTANEIRTLISVFRQRIKHARTNSGKVLQDCGLDDRVLLELQAELDNTMNAFVDEKVSELEQLAEEVMSMGIDESDLDLGKA